MKNRDQKNKGFPMFRVEHPRQMSPISEGFMRCENFKKFPDRSTAQLQSIIGGAGGGGSLQALSA